MPSGKEYGKRVSAGDELTQIRQSIVDALAKWETRYHARIDSPIVVARGADGELEGISITYGSRDGIP